MIVGFILMKVASCSQSVSPPKTTTTMAVTKGISGRRRVSAKEMASASTVVTMKEAVAKKIGPPSALMTGQVSASFSPRALAKKKTSSGPSSSTSLSQGLSFFSSAVCGSLGACSKAIVAHSCL